MQKLSNEWLREKRACKEGVAWWGDNGNNPDAIQTLNGLIVDDKLQWANWLITRLMSHPQQVKYAIFAAEQVLAIFEAKYPEDKRPRKAIEAAKAYLDNPTAADAAHAADAAAYAAHAAADAAHAADAAAYAAHAADAAAHAAYAAAYAAHAAYAAAYAAYAAHAAAYAAHAADAAAYAAADAAAEMKRRIIEYGISLIEEL